MEQQVLKCIVCCSFFLSSLKQLLVLEPSRQSKVVSTAARVEEQGMRSICRFLRMFLVSVNFLFFLVKFSL